MKMVMWYRLAIIKLIGLEKLSEMIGKKLFPLNHQENLRVKFRTSIQMLTASSYIRSLLSLLDWDVSDKLSLLQMPVLVVAAEHDYTPVKFKKEYCKKIKNAEVIVIPDSYHATPADQPDVLNRHIACFIKS